MKLLKTRRNTIFAHALLISLACATVSLCLWVFPSSATNQGAEFTQIKYARRIRSQVPDRWNFTVLNIDRPKDAQGAARFFLEFYLNGEIWFDEYNSTSYHTWTCEKGDTTTNSYSIKGWSAVRPMQQSLEARLYWLSNGEAHLEDTTSFTVDVTVLVPLQHIHASGFLAAYLIACFALLFYDYILSLDR